MPEHSTAPDRVEPPLAGQLDLFLNSDAAVALADLCATLRVHDTAGAQRALAALAAHEPGHRLFPAAERLVAAFTRMSASLSRAGAEDELNALEQSLVPAARGLLGRDALEVLAPLWRRVAGALAGAPFDAEHPRLHASYVYAQCLDWAGAIAAIEAVPGHASEPVLLGRLAEAHSRAGDRTAAIAAWCRLCWHAPDAASECLDAGEMPDAPVREAWLEFLELDAEPGTKWFPAYLLLGAPGLASWLPANLGDGPTSGERAFRAVRDVLQADGAEARRALQAAAPWLLEEYLKTRPARR
jgi:hypothetical protein